MKTNRCWITGLDDVFDRVLRVGIMDVVFGFLRCLHPAHHEKKRTLMLPIGSNFSEVVDLRDEATNFASKKRG